MLATLKRNLTPTRNFVRPLRQVMPELQTLRFHLERIERKMWSNPLHTMVEFFNIVSRLQDKDVLADALAHLEKIRERESIHTLRVQVDLLRKEIISAGRQPSGMNRTRTGETVTVDNVYLGNIRGLWTKPVRTWLAANDPFDPSAPENGTVRRVIEGQALRFMLSHTRSMIRLIDWIELESRKICD